MKAKWGRCSVSIRKSVSTVGLDGCAALEGGVDVEKLRRVAPISLE